jgi:hypothetical protein
LRRVASQILGTLLTLLGAADLLFVAPRLVPGSGAEVLLGEALRDALDPKARPLA